MATCPKCQLTFSDARAALGLLLCPTCGQEAAQQEYEDKHKRIGVAWNKGPEMYLGSPASTRHILKYEGGRKHLPIEPTANTRTIPTPSTRISPTVKPQYEFSHWEFPVDELGRRTKRAVLRRIS